MNLFLVIMTALGLAADAFTVAASKGLGSKKLSVQDAFKLGIAFGVFQGIMPFFGWVIGSRFSSLIENYSHWVALIILSFIGGKMIYESLKSVQDTVGGSVSFKVLIALGVATSIDALVVGFTFMQIDILTVLCYCGIIAAITAVISFTGYFLGNLFGSFIGNKAEVIGGIVLICIGISMVVQKIL